MTAPPPRGPWWKKTRWRAVIAFWLTLPALYVGSTGPAHYLHHRGWSPWDDIETAERSVAFYGPLYKAVRGTPIARPLYRWNAWWAELGAQHADAAASD